MPTIREILKSRLSEFTDLEINDELIEEIVAIESERELDDLFNNLLSFKDPQHFVFLNEMKQKLFHPGRRYKSEKGKQESIIKPSSSAPKKKPKFVAVDGVDLDATVLKGRHSCNCQASKHALISNCMKCGRIVCEQEGSGPCLFCGNLVCSREEEEIINSATKKGEKLRKHLIDQGRPKGWEEALAQRNRLLEYDRNSARRTQVVDDELDYFQNNSVWLSDAEREKLQALEAELSEKKHVRKAAKLTLDLKNKVLLEHNESISDAEQDIYNEILNNQMQQEEREFGIDYLNENMELDFPSFELNEENAHKSSGKRYDGVYSRVQDKEILEMSDLRNCMSMHQPWASLLIAGLKKHEGRTWYSGVRGRLWIASTAKPVNKDDIETMEKFYKAYYNHQNLEFPTQYPSCVLLGHVTVDDCLPQEEYRKIYPNGESESPYVFICTEPKELRVLFPIKGQHKIYKLDQNIHLAALKSIQKLERNS